MTGDQLIETSLREAEAKGWSDCARWWLEVRNCPHIADVTQEEMERRFPDVLGKEVKADEAPPVL